MKPKASIFSCALLLTLGALGVLAFSTPSEGPASAFAVPASADKKAGHYSSQRVAAVAGPDAF
jgi:hypothetical protein